MQSLELVMKCVEFSLYHYETVVEVGLHGDKSISKLINSMEEDAVGVRRRLLRRSLTGIARGHGRQEV